MKIKGYYVFYKVYILSMESLLEYQDYRLYLADYYEYAKAKYPHFSYRYFSLKVGVKSPVFLKLVIDGKRNLSLNTIQGISEAIGHTQKEAKYFKHLVLFDQAKTTDEKQEHYLLLSEIVGSIKEKTLDYVHFEFLNTWYHPVIRELLTLNQWENIADLARQVFPPLNVVQVRESIHFLERTGFVKKDDNGHYHQTEPHLNSGKGVMSIAVRNYHRHMLEHAAQSIDRFDKSHRFVSGATLGVSKTCYEAIELEYRRFREKILKMVAIDSEPDRVIQMALALHPCAWTTKDIKILKTKITPNQKTLK